MNATLTICVLCAEHARDGGGPARDDAATRAAIPEERRREEGDRALQTAQGRRATRAVQTVDLQGLVDRRQVAKEERALHPTGSLHSHSPTGTASSLLSIILSICPSCCSLICSFAFSSPPFV